MMGESLDYRANVDSYGEEIENSSSCYPGQTEKAAAAAAVTTASAATEV